MNLQEFFGHVTEAVILGPTVPDAAWHLGIALIVLFAFLGTIPALIEYMANRANLQPIIFQIIFILGVTVAMTTSPNDSRYTNWVFWYVDSMQTIGKEFANFLVQGHADPLESIHTQWIEWKSFNDARTEQLLKMGKETPASVNQAGNAVLNYVGSGISSMWNGLITLAISLVMMIPLVFAFLLLLSQAVILAIAPSVGYLLVPFLILPSYRVTALYWLKAILEISAWVITLAFITVMMTNILHLLIPFLLGSGGTAAYGISKLPPDVAAKGAAVLKPYVIPILLSVIGFFAYLIYQVPALTNALLIGQFERLIGQNFSSGFYSFFGRASSSPNKQPQTTKETSPTDGGRGGGNPNVQIPHPPSGGPRGSQGTGQWGRMDRAQKEAIYFKTDPSPAGSHASSMSPNNPKNLRNSSLANKESKYKRPQP